MTRPRIKAYIYLIIVSVVWGIAGPVIKYTLGGLNPLVFLTYRFAVSSLFGLGYLIATRTIGKAEKDNFWGVVWYGLITTTFSLGILFLGIQRTTAIEASLLTAIVPFAVALSGSLLLGDIITKKERVGMLIAFGGTLVTLIDPLIKGGIKAGQFTGNIFVLGYVVGVAISAVMAKKLLRKGVNPLVLTNISFVVGFVSLFPVAVLKLGITRLIATISTTAPGYQIGVLYMALISGNLAYWLWTKGQKTIEVSEAGVFEYLVPVFSAPLAILWLKESVSVVFVIGAAIIAFGVFVAEYKGRLPSLTKHH